MATAKRRTAAATGGQVGLIKPDDGEDNGNYGEDSGRTGEVHRQECTRP
jgi:hypothetical protein